MTEKCLFIGFFVLFALSAVFLMGQNIRGIDPEGKNWWSLAFSEPANASSLAFTVTNHTEDPSFRYAVTRGSETLDIGEFSVPSGMSQSQSPKAGIDLSGRITITVNHGGSEETIFRSL